MQAVYYAASTSSLTILHILFMVANTRFYRHMADVRTDRDLKTHTEIFLIAIFYQGMASPWMILLVLSSIGFPLPLIPAAVLANACLFSYQPSTLGHHGNMWSNMTTLTRFPAPPSSFKKDSPLPRLTFWQFIRKDAKNTYDRLFPGDDQV